MPKHVHWDLWLGPAAYRPYANGYHPFAWRGCWDFGTGALGDMACHTMNMPFMALDLREPDRGRSPDLGPQQRDAIPGGRSSSTSSRPTTSGRPVSMTWYDGKKLPPVELFEKVQWPKEAIKDGPKGDKAEKFETAISGALIIGDKGTLYSPGDYADKFYLPEGMDKPKVEFERSPGHFVEFARAIKEGKPRHVELPGLLGPADRDRAAGQPGRVERQEGRLGRQEPEGHERARARRR